MVDLNPAVALSEPCAGLPTLDEGRCPPLRVIVLHTATVRRVSASETARVRGERPNWKLSGRLWSNLTRSVGIA